MSIPLPMIWSARISTSKKVGLCVMFCGGLITAVFGGLRCGYVLANTKDGPQQAGEWSCRESFVAVFVTNFPIIFPIVHRAIRGRMTGRFSSIDGPSGKGTPGNGNGNGTKGSSSGFKLSTISKKGEKKKKFQHPLSLPAETFFGDTRYGSEEDIIEGGAAAGNNMAGNGTEGRVPSIPEEGREGRGIKVTTEWRVQDESAETLRR